VHGTNFQAFEGGPSLLTDPQIITAPYVSKLNSDDS
jgi:hypothetical protein